MHCAMPPLARHQLSQVARPPIHSTIKVGSIAQTWECNQLGWNQQNGGGGQPGRSRCVRETVRAKNANWIMLDRAVEQEAHSFGKDGWVPRVGGQL